MWSLFSQRSWGQGGEPSVYPMILSNDLMTGELKPKSMSDGVSAKSLPAIIFLTEH